MSPRPPCAAQFVDGREVRPPAPERRTMAQLMNTRPSTIGGRESRRFQQGPEYAVNLPVHERVPFVRHEHMVASTPSVKHIADPLVEQQREDELLVVTCVDGPLATTCNAFPSRRPQEGCSGRVAEQPTQIFRGRLRSAVCLGCLRIRRSGVRAPPGAPLPDRLVHNNLSGVAGEAVANWRML